MRAVRVGNSRRLRVEDAAADLTGGGGERLRAKPSANRRGELGDGAGGGGIVPAIRRRQAIERIRDGRADAPTAIVVIAIVAIEEYTQQLDLIDDRPRFKQRCERCGGR